jgi:hypothetical protein
VLSIFVQSNAKSYYLEMPVSLITFGRKKLTTQTLSYILVVLLCMLHFVRPSFEVVKGGRILKKIKNMPIKIASVFVMCNPLQDLFKNLIKISILFVSGYMEPK